MSPWKTLKTAAIVALATGAAVLAPGEAAADGDAPQQIVVHGSGEVRAHPDALTVDVGVEARGARIDEARNQANETMTRVLDAVRALQLPDLTMQTSVLQVSPLYEPQVDGRPPRISGYAVSNRVTITLQHAPDDLGARGARILDAALNAGANTVGGISFFLADPSAAQDEALAAAVRAAQHDAQTIAEAAGVTLGSVTSIEEGGGMRFVPRAAMMAAVASTPVEVQDVVVQSDVTARFAFRSSTTARGRSRTRPRRGLHASRNRITRSTPGAAHTCAAPGSLFTYKQPP